MKGFIIALIFTIISAICSIFLWRNYQEWKEVESNLKVVSTFLIEKDLQKYFLINGNWPKDMRNYREFIYRNGLCNETNSYLMLNNIEIVQEDSLLKFILNPTNGSPNTNVKKWHHYFIAPKNLLLFSLLKGQIRDRDVSAFFTKGDKIYAMNKEIKGIFYKFLTKEKLAYFERKGFICNDRPVIELSSKGEMSVYYSIIDFDKNSYEFLPPIDQSFTEFYKPLLKSVLNRVSQEKWSNGYDKVVFPLTIPNPSNVVLCH